MIMNRGSDMYSKNRQLIILISWLAVLLWIVVIYMFSAQPASVSGALSLKVTASVNSLISKVFPGIKLSHHIIRKGAHLVVFSVLGILVMNALRRSGISSVLSSAVLICIAVAASDEFHQIFVPGRVPSLTDVLLNFIGTGLGIVFYLLLMRFIGQESGSLEEGQL